MAAAAATLCVNRCSEHRRRDDGNINCRNAAGRGGGEVCAFDKRIITSKI